ncbi:MAG: HmuY family protein [Deltaproteobacteria bacterium]|nr:HmuY family protein [Deltaproteobacteria bacterium]
MRLLLCSLSASIVVVTACGPPPGTGEGEGEGEGEAGPTCTEPVAVPCRDDVFASLSMSLTDNADGATVGDGTVVNDVDGDGFDTFVDARSNGAFNSGPWVYGRFTADGLEKLDLFDDESLDSMDWDIAFQRFSIRLNSGFGGPSCVTAARTAPSTDFETLAAVPEGLTFNDEEFMTDNGDGSCTIVPDGSGQGSPGVVMQNWWEYPGCVATTGNVYVVSLADGQRVKLVVTQYYGSGQSDCNDGSGIGSESANVRFRWAFL